MTQLRLQTAEIADENARPHVRMGQAALRRVAVPTEAFGLELFLGHPIGPLKVETARARRLDDMSIDNEAFRREPLQEALPQPQHVGPFDRVGIDEHGRDAVPAKGVRATGAERSEHTANIAGALRDLEVRNLGAGDRQHHRHALPKVLVEARFERPSHDGRQVVHRVQSPLEILPYLLGVLDGLEQLDKYHGEVLPAQRIDLLDFAATAQLFLDFATNLLLNLFRFRARVDRNDGRNLDRYDRIVPLRHDSIREVTPDERGNQGGPCHGTLVDKELRNRHRRRPFYFRDSGPTSGTSTTRTASPSARRKLPATTIGFPIRTWERSPSTIRKRLSYTPSKTIRRWRAI